MREYEVSWRFRVKTEDVFIAAVKGMMILEREVKQGPIYLDVCEVRTVASGDDLEEEERIRVDGGEVRKLTPEEAFSGELARMKRWGGL